MAEDADASREALDPLDYLTSSEHRVQVLEALTATIPEPGLETPGHEPRELRDLTGASDATVSRILNEFVERGWASRDASGGYTATRKGQSIAIGFVPLRDSIEAIHHLGDAVALLPLTELSIGLEHFRTATVREPKAPQPRDIGLFLTGLLADSATFDALTYIPGTAGLLADVTEQIATGSLESTQILAERIIDFYVDVGGADVRERARDHLEAGAVWYQYDGHVPCNIFIFDEAVVFENSQVDGVKDGTVIVTQDAVVREWARDVFERYRENSRRVTEADLSE